MFIHGSDGEESACNAGDLGSIPGLERLPGGGNDYQVFLPREFHGLKSLVARVRGVTESDMTNIFFHLQAAGDSHSPSGKTEKLRHSMCLAVF